MTHDGSHRRYNPLLDEWVLCSPRRLERPWQGRVESVPPVDRPRHDPLCYLCPGSTRASRAVNPGYTGTFVFDNDFPALDLGHPERSEGSNRTNADPSLTLLRMTPESGVCRVVAFSPRHDLSLSTMSAEDVRGVVDTWADETTRLGADPEIGHVQVFENRGEMMGCSNPHPHSQIWATRTVPTMPMRMLASFHRHHASNGRDLLGDYLDVELRERARIVRENDSWVALVPYWAVWPFETMLIPRKRAADLPSLDDDGRTDLARIIGDVTRCYDALFGVEFPYSMGVMQSPSDSLDHPEWRVHLAFRPPLLRSATVRKFLTGYEMASEPQRDLTPEQAAQRLRET